LLEAVPEAHIVQTHRDVAEIVPSLNSLLFSLHALVKRICDHFKIEFSAALAERAPQLIAARPKDRYGRHVYSAEDFGTSTAAIHERFAGSTTSTSQTGNKERYDD
jgi:hypothetical protein